MNKAEVEFVGPYDNDVCHFCGAHQAAYKRPENSNPRGPKFDSCEKCARKYAPEQPEHLKKALAEHKANTENKG